MPETVSLDPVPATAANTVSMAPVMAPVLPGTEAPQLPQPPQPATVTPPQGATLTQPAPPTPAPSTTPTGTSTPVAPPADFKPLLPKDPSNADQVSVIDSYNQFRLRGGQNSELDYDTNQAVLNAAKGGEAGITQQDALSNAETYYQQVFKKIPATQRGIDWGNVLWNAPGALLNMVKDTAVGGTELAGDILQSANPFIPEADRHTHGARVQIAEVAGIRQAGMQTANLVLGAGDIYNQANLESQIAKTTDPVQREALERQESEIFRQRALRGQAIDTISADTQKDIAGAYKMMGLVGNSQAIANPQSAPTQQETGAIATIADPTNWIAGGAEAAVKGVAEGTVRAGVRIGEYNLATDALRAAQDTTTTLAASRAALESQLAGTADQAVQNDIKNQLGRLSVQERDAQSKLAEATGNAATLGQAVQAQTQAMAKPGLFRSLGAATTGGIGNLFDGLSKGVDVVHNLPEDMATRIFGEDDSPIKTFVQSKMEDMAHSIPHMIQEGPLLSGLMHGGPVGALVGAAHGMAINFLGRMVTDPAVFGAIARDFKTIGTQLGMGRQTLPFWRAIGEQNLSGFTKYAASKLDNQLVYAIPGTFKAALPGAAIGGGAAYLSAGGAPSAQIGPNGQLNVTSIGQQVAQGAVTGGLFGMAGGGLGQIGKFNSPENLHIAAIGDRKRFVQTLSPDSLKLFNQLRPDEQLSLGVFGHAHPDLNVRFTNDPAGSNGFHGVDDKGPYVNVNVAGDRPLAQVLQHEIGHHVASFGLGDVVRDQMIGNVYTNEPGMFTAFDNDGKPIIRNDPDTGQTSYQPDQRFLRYKNDYNERFLRDNPGQEPVDDYAISQEMFAELHATQFSNPRDVQSIIRGGSFIPSDIVGPNVVQNWFGKMGMGYDANTGRVVPSQSSAGVRGLMETVAKSSREREFRTASPNAEEPTSKIKPDVWRANPNAIYQNLDGAGILSRDPKTGEVIKDASGLPVIKSSAEADRDHAAFTRGIVDHIVANPQILGQQGDNYLKLVTDRAGRTLYQGQRVPQEIFDHMTSLNEHNPVQIDNWRKINGVNARNDGSMMHTIYNTAGKGGKYATIGAKGRSVVPLYTQIWPKEGQVNIGVYDPEQLQATAAKMIKRPAGQKLWNGKMSVMMDDVNSYLENLVNNRPGETGIGLEKKGFINQLFGFNLENNPTIDAVANKNRSVIKDFRLDRINKVREVPGVTRPFRSETYEQIRGYAMPRSAPVQPEVPDTISKVPNIVPESQDRGDNLETIYRGKMSLGQQGNFFSPDKEWARNFTQSGLDSEITTQKIRSNDIYEPKEEVFAGDPDEVDKATALARKAGKKAVRLSEGKDQPPSVFVFNRSALRR